MMALLACSNETRARQRGVITSRNLELILTEVFLVLFHQRIEYRISVFVLPIRRLDINIYLHRCEDNIHE